MNETLMHAAENTVSSFLMETGEEKNNKKILEYSFIINNFIEQSDFFIQKIKQANTDMELTKIAQNIYQKIDELGTAEIIELFEDYSEYFLAAYLITIEEAKIGIEGFKEEEIHRNLVLHFLTIIPIQNQLTQQGNQHEIH